MNIKRLAVGPLAANCYILFGGRESAVIDPGGGAGLIVSEIKKEKSKLKYIINTHSHFDHIAANRDLRQAAGGRLLIHEKEKPYIDFEPDAWLKAGDTLEIGGEKLKVIQTPGHSPGSICLVGPDCIFTGDTLFRDGYGRTDLPGGNSREMADSLSGLSEIIKPGMAVYPGHGAAYTA